MPLHDVLAGVVRDVLASTNEVDRNGETANVVDGLFVIAREIGHLASAVSEVAAALRERAGEVG